MCVGERERERYVLKDYFSFCLSESGKDYEACLLSSFFLIAFVSDGWLTNYMNGIVTVCVRLGTVRTGRLFLFYLEVEHTGSSRRHRDFPHSQTVSNFLVRSDRPL